jgi:hypothetical protein
MAAPAPLGRKRTWEEKHEVFPPTLELGFDPHWAANWHLANYLELCLRSLQHTCLTQQGYFEKDVILSRITSSSGISYHKLWRA